MLKQAENKVRIEGILSEVDLKTGNFVKDGKTVDTIGGVVKIKVTQPINGVDTELEVPVHMFSLKLKNNGDPNPAYESIEKVMKEFVSIAAAGSEEGADRVRITGGNIQMNEYYSPDGRLISFPRISASFMSKIKKDECKPEATFTCEMMVANAAYEVDSDGVETDKYKISAIVPQYGGKVDVIEFIALSKNVIDAISQYWTKGDSVKAQGRLNFSSKTETTTQEVDFGEPIQTTRTVSVSELVITGGSSTPLEGEFAFDVEEINKAIADRKVRLEELKTKAANKAKSNGNGNGASTKASKPTVDLGF